MVVIGIDQHKRFSVAASLDPASGETTTTRLEHADPDGIRAYLRQWEPGVAVTLESGGQWYWLVDLLEDEGARVTLCNATETRRLWRMRAKTDRLDALGLAELTVQGLVPTVYVPQRAQRDARERHRHRMRLVCLRRTVKNTIHALLGKLGIQPSFSDLFGKAGRRFLEALELRAPYGEQLSGRLKVLDVLDQEIRRVESAIRREVKAEPLAALLQTVPGIAERTAYLVLYETGPVDRFPTVKQFVRYACLAPGTWQSGGSRRSRGVGRGGNLYLKTGLTEAARTAANVDPGLHAVYERFKQKKGSRYALVVVAHKLAKAVYFIMRRREPYRARPVQTGRHSGKPVPHLGRSAPADEAVS